MWLAISKKQTQHRLTLIFEWCSEFYLFTYKGEEFAIHKTIGGGEVIESLTLTHYRTGKAVQVGFHETGDKKEIAEKKAIEIIKKYENEIEDACINNPIINF